MREALARRDSLTREQATELAVLAKNDSEARDELVLRCMGLITSAAKKFNKSLKEDAFGEASAAFLEAVDSFDPGTGDFRTWANFLMRDQLNKASKREQSEAHRRYNSSLDPRAVTPNTLKNALVDRVITERQAGILHGFINGTARSVAMSRYSIAEKTYYRELERAREALRKYVS